MYRKRLLATVAAATVALTPASALAAASWSARTSRPAPYSKAHRGAHHAKAPARFRTAAASWS